MFEDDEIIFRSNKRKRNIDEDTLSAFNFKKNTQIHQSRSVVQPKMSQHKKTSHLNIKPNRRPLNENYDLNNRKHQELNKRVALSEPISKSKKSSNKRSNDDYQIKPRKKRRILLKLIVLILLLLIGFALFVLYTKNTSEPINVVVVGVDARANEDESQTRSDALMLVKTSVKNNEILMSSIPRDTYTYIPCEKTEDKITHAYVYGNLNYGKENNGGIKCILESVEKLTEFKTEKYIKMNFESTQKVVDYLGGVDITPQSTFCLPLKELTPQLCLTEGEKVHLDGKQALAFSRHRKSDSDFERGKRQQQVVVAMLSKIKTMPILEWPNAIGEVKKMVETNLDTVDLIKLASVMINDPKTTSHKFEGEGVLIDGLYYFQIFPNSMKEFQDKANAIK